MDNPPTDEELLNKFKEWCTSHIPRGSQEIFIEEDWHSLSIGFFVALGANEDQAYNLAREARYTHEYWIE